MSTVFLHIDIKKHPSAYPTFFAVSKRRPKIDLLKYSAPSKPHEHGFSDCINIIETKRNLFLSRIQNF